MKSLCDIYESCVFALIIVEPTSYEETQEEITTIEKNGTWELIDLPQKIKAITVKWVYKVKYKLDGNVQKYKIKLVVKGYTQQQGIDYFEIFSPVARFKTVCIVLIVAAQMK
ncbi:unnamed protein product [Spirodela intermedia]|uniref:Reverse transcriptase Ty1/copia-type domain-containing protein n=1 Tax=Spirodela intermedia TaxID=51605 RepID=A0A7I8L9L7_SPIIN|nr:unnamed protein product [Spirodela intermedia]